MLYLVWRNEIPVVSTVNIEFCFLLTESFFETVNVQSYKGPCYRSDSNQSFVLGYISCDVFNNCYHNFQFTRNLTNLLIPTELIRSKTKRQHGNQFIHNYLVRVFIAKHMFFIVHMNNQCSLWVVWCSYIW
jgi:hypothetical protein